MKRADLCELVRSAASALAERHVVVIGAPSWLATYGEADLPDHLIPSAEAGWVLAQTSSPVADLLAGNPGYSSPCGHASELRDPEYGAATLPGNWVSRLVPLLDPSSDSIGWCLEPHDLCAAMSIIGRREHIEFVSVAVVNRLIDPTIVRERIVDIAHLGRGRATALMARLSHVAPPPAERDRWQLRHTRTLHELRAGSARPSSPSSP